jgi:hypothetical protein
MKFTLIFIILRKNKSKKKNLIISLIKIYLKLTHNLKFFKFEIITN